MFSGKTCLQLNRLRSKKSFEDKSLRQPQIRKKRKSTYLCLKNQICAHLLQMLKLHDHKHIDHIVHCREGHSLFLNTNFAS